MDSKDHKHVFMLLKAGVRTLHFACFECPETTSIRRDRFKDMCMPEDNWTDKRGIF